MPQMAPINWLTLFMFFTATFIIFNSMNYFSFHYNLKTYQIKKFFSKINWKW